MNINDIRERFATFTNVDLHGPVDEGVIERSEQRLGLKLPPEYRAFIKEFGCGGVESEEFVGLGGAPHLDLVALKERLGNRNKPFPVNYYPLRTDGFGNYDCLDASHPTHGGEFAIVEWRHDVAENYLSRVLASSYFDWFEQMLDLIRNVDASGDA